ncbi:YjcZ family sporulation protein [Paenibacillus sp. Marseille-Q7038]
MSGSEERSGYGYGGGYGGGYGDSKSIGAILVLFILLVIIAKSFMSY